MISFPDDLPQPSIGTSSQHHVRLLTAEFGDGYGQRVVDGINAHHQEWSVVWQLITTEEADRIEQFLIDKMGVESFLWLPPKAGEAVSVICDLNTLKRTPQGQLDTIQAVFTEQSTINSLIAFEEGY